MGLGIAMRAFSAALFDKQAAERIRAVLSGDDTAAIEQAASESAASETRGATSVPAADPAAASPPTRSDAITLLSALQREARLVDLIQENLSEFSDAQVGAAARPCLEQSSATLNRLFDLKPVCEAADGSTVDVGPEETAARYQWTGEGSGTSGSLIHHGWQASQVELPQFSGDAADALIVAPAQIQR